MNYQLKVVPVFLAIGLVPWSVATAQGTISDSNVAAARNRPTGGDYLVVAMIDQESGFRPAAELLAQRHDAEIFQASTDKPAQLLSELQQRQPKTVAFVVNPDDLDINLAQEILLLSTRVDADPFVDFAYGFITGRDGEAALQLVKAPEVTDADRKPAITMFGVGSREMGRSSVQKSAWPLRGATVPVTAFQSAGDSDDERDEAFIRESMARLSKPPILVLASHGYPDGLVGGPKAADLLGVDLSGSVVLNIACYNGVTQTWYEEDWSTMQLKKRQVSAKDSLCLQIIDNGVAGYVAWTCPRPAGPTLMGDAMILASSGRSLGELRREDANNVVLAHLMSGEPTLKTVTLVDGAKLEAGRTAGQAVRRMSTGGILIGDPAFIPFAEQPDSDPRTVKVTEQVDRLIVNARVQTSVFHFYASEQINYWNDSDPAMRLETKVPIGDHVVTNVQVKEPPAGVVQFQLVAAVEQDRGQRFLRLKMTFPQPKDTASLQTMAREGLSGQFEVETTNGPSDFKRDSRIFRGEASQ